LTREFERQLVEIVRPRANFGWIESGFPDGLA
jgi:transposase